MRAVSVIAKYAGIFHPGSSDGTVLIDDLSEANISKNHLFSRNRVTIDVIRKGEWLKVDKSCRSPRSLRFPAREVRRVLDSGQC